MERQLLDAAMEFTCKKSIVAFVELLVAQPFDWDSIVGAVQNAAITKFMSFFSSRIETLGDCPN